MNTATIENTATESKIATLQYATPSQSSLNEQKDYYLSVVNTLIIDSPVQYEIAAGELAKVKGIAAELEAKRKAITQPMDAAKKGVMDLFRPTLEALISIENTLKAKMLSFDKAQELERIKQQAEINAQAAKDRAQLEKQAAKIEKKGDFESAEALRMTAQVMTAPVIESTTPVIKGVQTRKSWKAEAVDLLAMVKYIAEHPELIGMLEVNQGALNKYASAMNKNAKIDGVRFFEESVIASRKGCFFLCGYKFYSLIIVVVNGG